MWSTRLIDISINQTAYLPTDSDLKIPYSGKLSLVQIFVSMNENMHEKIFVV